MTKRLSGMDGGANDAITAFEHRRRAHNRAQQAKTAMCGSLFVLAVASSLWVSEVSVGKFVEGFPGMIAYIRGTLPVLRAEHLVADVAA